MSRIFNEEGLVIRKTHLNEGNLLITFLSKGKGKLIVGGYGVKKITSKRLSHLEIGNYLKFTYHVHNDHYSLGETELLFGHSKIKKDEDRLNALFLVCFIANKIFPEHEGEPKIFSQVINYLKTLNNDRYFSLENMHQMVTNLFITAGFLTKEKANGTSFDLYAFVENTTNSNIKSRFGFLS